MRTKVKKEIQKCKGRGNSQYIYQSELDKACFKHDMAYWDFKYFIKAEKVKNVDMFASVILELATRQLSEELHKPIIRKFLKGKVHSSFIDNT